MRTQLILLVIAQQKRWYIGYSVICWGLPIVAVGVCMALQLTDTGNVGYGELTAYRMLS